MSEPAAAGLDLGPKERLLGSWPAESEGNERDRGGPGLLVLTNRRCLFLRRPSRFGLGRAAGALEFERTLETLGRIAPERAWIRIGYGDRFEVPAVRLEDRSFRFARGSAVGPIVEAIVEARRRRVAELGPSA